MCAAMGPAGWWKRSPRATMTGASGSWCGTARSTRARWTGTRGWTARCGPRARRGRSVLYRPALPHRRGALQHRAAWERMRDGADWPDEGQWQALREMNSLDELCPASGPSRGTRGCWSSTLTCLCPGSPTWSLPHRAGVRRRLGPAAAPISGSVLREQPPLLRARPGLRSLRPQAAGLRDELLLDAPRCVGAGRGIVGLGYRYRPQDRPVRRTNVTLVRRQP